ncbi:tetratricopeptide repeat protein [Pseudofrankia saprophytica]|uniref:tetratricopeptide repeat protein n=1 Tax=Pseudofrankia saprophytica TaxID=298655 RepID=UPI000234BCA0|nr:tetratricopeptide repeat protein [Pseudofrankia saprophytica]
MGDGGSPFARLDPPAARERFAAELTQAMLASERRLGRSFDRAELAKRLSVSRASLYAYLKGTTLPSSAVLDLLLTAIAIAGPDAGRLATLRDDAEIAQKLRRTRSSPAASRQDSSSDRRSGPPDPAGGEPAASAAGPRPAVSLSKTAAHPLPHQLPLVTHAVVGRHIELAALDRLATGTDNEPPVALITVDGTAGAGKTTLAVYWSQQVADRFPDGQLYVDLRGFGPGDPMEPGTALHGFLVALGADPAAIPPSLEGRSALFRSLIAGRRVLVLLDNARSTEQARPLLPGSPSCLTIVTSRTRLEGLIVRNGAGHVAVGVLPHPGAVTLLSTRLGAGDHEVGPELDELARECACLPLALSLAAARVGGSSRELLRDLLAELRQYRSRLDVLSSDEADLDLRTVFQWSYATLGSSPSRLFALLGIHPGPDIDRSACAALLDSPEGSSQALRQLARANLLVEHRPGRFTSHDLLRGFAQELAASLDPAQTRAALERMLDYYLSTALRADAVSQPWVRFRSAPTAGAEPVPAAAADRPPGGAASPEPFSGPRPSIATHDEAMAWFEEELPILLSLVGTAATQGFESHAWRLAWALMVFLRRTGRRTEREDVQRAAVEAADRVGHGHARAASQRKLADALARLGQQAEARALLWDALAAFTRLGDTDGARQVHLSFARVFEAGSRYAQALHHAATALDLACGGPVSASSPDRVAAEGQPVRDGEPLAVADCLNLVSIQLCHLGRYEEALSRGLEALALYDRIGHVEGQANILRHLGRAEGELGHHEAAIRHYQRSRLLDRELGDRYWEAQVMDHLADEHLALGDEASAQHWRGHALRLLESLSHPDAETVRAKPRVPRYPGPSAPPPPAAPAT